MKKTAWAYRPSFLRTLTMGTLLILTLALQSACVSPTSLRSSYTSHSGAITASSVTPPAPPPSPVLPTKTVTQASISEVASESFESEIKTVEAIKPMESTEPTNPTEGSETLASFKAPDVNTPEGSGEVMSSTGFATFNESTMELTDTASTRLATDDDTEYTARREIWTDTVEEGYPLPDLEPDIEAARALPPVEVFNGASGSSGFGVSGASSAGASTLSVLSPQVGSVIGNEGAEGLVIQPIPFATTEPIPSGAFGAGETDLTIVEPIVIPTITPLSPNIATTYEVGPGDPLQPADLNAYNLPVIESDGFGAELEAAE